MTATHVSQTIGRILYHIVNLQWTGKASYATKAVQTDLNETPLRKTIGTDVGVQTESPAAADSKSPAKTRSPTPPTDRKTRSSSSPTRTKSPGLDIVRNSRIKKRSSKGPQRVSRVKGLKNPNQLCYQNSVYQCLFNMPEFASYLDGLHKLACYDNKLSRCVACKLKGLFNSYANGDRAIPAYRRDALASVMRRTIPEYHPFAEDIKGQMQSDPYPFLDYLLEELKDRESSDDGISSDEIFGMDFNQEWTCAECGSVHSSTGQTAGDHSIGISLDIQDPKEGLRMMSYMRETGFKTALGIRCESEQCIAKYGAKSEGFERIKKRHITKSPEILVIQLKRDAMVDKHGEDTKGGIKETKLCGQVPYEEYINIGEFTETGAPLFYQLQGVVAHNGPKNLSSGHYIAAVRNPDGRTFCTINDSTPDGQWRGGDVRELYEPLSGKQKFDPCVLFYTKM